MSFGRDLYERLRFYKNIQREEWNAHKERTVSSWYFFFSKSQQNT